MDKLQDVAHIKQLSIGFKQENRVLTAVDGLDFTLKPGETLALLGESGCGKSITALGLMRLLPQQAGYGNKSQINLGQEDILRLPESWMRQLRGKRLAMIFQEPMTALNPVLRIDQQLKEAVHRSKKLTGTALKNRLLELLREVELSEPEIRLQQYPHQLSGGQKQRIVLAIALANKPDILIADEPTTALDVTVQAQILALLKKLQQQHQMSMLLITHDLGVVKAVADRVCVMYAGQLMEQAAVADFFKDPKHPYSQQLMASLPSIEKRDFRLQAITGAVPSLDNLPGGCLFHPRCIYAFSRCSTELPLVHLVELHQVRCHLYPGSTSLPPLVSKQEKISERPESAETILSVNQVKIYFKLSNSWFKAALPPIKAVDDLSFSVQKGRTLALVGESGCGKTTVSRAIMRLQPLTAGEILFRGQNISTMNGRMLKQYRKKIQIIFQDPFSSLNPRLTVSEIIAEGMIAQGLSAGEIRKKNLQLFEQVNLPRNCLHRYPHQFSGGQRQRICIARALATEPEILVCDEPTSALDVSVQAQILNLLKELQYELGMSYLFITHNMAVVSYMAHDVLVMCQGKAVEQGAVQQIMNAPQEEYTKKLLASVLSID